MTNNSKFSKLPKQMIRKVLSLDVNKKEKLALLDYLYKEYLLSTAKFSFESFCELVIKDEKRINSVCWYLYDLYYCKCIFCWLVVRC